MHDERVDSPRGVEAGCFGEATAGMLLKVLLTSATSAQATCPLSKKGPFQVSFLVLLVSDAHLPYSPARESNRMTLTATKALVFPSHQSNAFFAIHTKAIIHTQAIHK